MYIQSNSCRKYYVNGQDVKKCCHSKFGKVFSSKKRCFKTVVSKKSRYCVKNVHSRNIKKASVQQNMSYDQTRNPILLIRKKVNTEQCFGFEEIRGKIDQRNIESPAEDRKECEKKLNDLSNGLNDLVTNMISQLRYKLTKCQMKELKWMKGYSEKLKVTAGDKKYDSSRLGLCLGNNEDNDSKSKIIRLEQLLSEMYQHIVKLSYVPPLPMDVKGRNQAVLITRLKRTKNPHKVGKILDLYTPDNLDNLSRNKRFPKDYWQCMNFRLLENKLRLHGENKIEGMYRQVTTEKKINSALTDFYKKRISDDILNDPVSAAQYFKRINQSLEVFSHKTFLELSKYVTDRQKQAMTLESVLIKSIKELLPKDQDRVIVSLRIMRFAYKLAPEKAGTEKIVAKDDLAKMFAQSTFKQSRISLKKNLRTEIDKAKKNNEMCKKVMVAVLNI